MCLGICKMFQQYYLSQFLLIEKLHVYTSDEAVLHDLKVTGRHEVASV